MARRIPFVYMAILFLVSMQVLGCSNGRTVQALTISGSLPATGTVGTPYSGTLTVSGGNFSYTWTVSGVPTGIVVSGTNSATLTLAGTPTAASTTTFTVTVTDTRGDSQTTTVTVVIVPGGATISGEFAATGTAGVLYTASLTASGGTAPYTWVVTGFPDTFTITGTNTPTVTISGTPSAAATYNVSAAVTDAGGHTTTVTASIVIAPAQALAIKGTFPATGMVGVSYAGSLMATGGTAPYTWNVTGFPSYFATNHPSATVVTLSGFPKAATTYNVTATLTDAAAHTATYSVNVVISASGPVGPTLTITPTALGTLAQGTAITPVTLTASPATVAPYTWTVTSGALPAGLVLNNGTTTSATTITSTDTSITISGTPTGSGAYNFTLGITDSSAPQGSGSQGFSGTVTGIAAANTCESPTLRGNEAALTAPYAYLLKGAESDDSPIAWIGSFTPNGAGGITAADLDVVSLDDGAESFQIQLAGSSYSYGSDGRGCLYLAFQSENSENPAVKTGSNTNLARGKAHRHVAVHPGTLARLLAQVKANAQPQAQPNVGTVAFSFVIGASGQTGRITEFDYVNSGIVAAGQMHQQTVGDFAVSKLTPHFAFGLDGWFNTDGEGDIVRTAVAGSFADAAGTLTLGVADYNVDGTASGKLTGGTGTLETVSTTTGRGVGFYTFDNNNLSTTVNFVYYVVNASDIYYLSIDDPTQDTSYLLSGRSLASDATSTPLSGNYLIAFSGLDLGAGPEDVGANYVAAGVLQGITTNTVTPIPNVKIFINDAGAFTTANFSNVTFTTDTASGRVVFANGSAGGPAPIAYLTSTAEEDGIAAFLAGTDAFASSGFLAFQSGSAPNYTAADLTGPYAFGTSEDVAGVQGSADGVFNFVNSGFTTYLSTLDSILVSNGLADGGTGGVSGNGSYNVNTDGSGSLTATDGSNLGMVFATNGTLIVGVDSTDGTQPQLYIFVEQEIPE